MWFGGAHARIHVYTSALQTLSPIKHVRSCGRNCGWLLRTARMLQHAVDASTPRMFTRVHICPQVITANACTY